MSGEDVPGAVVELGIDADELDRGTRPERRSPCDRLFAADADEQRRLGLREDVVGREEPDAVVEQGAQRPAGAGVLDLTTVAQRDEGAGIDEDAPHSPYRSRLTIVEGLLTGLGAALVARVGEPMLATLRERVVRRVLSLPLQDIEWAGSGDLLARVGDDVAEVSATVRGALPAMATSGLAIALTIVGLAPAPAHARSKRRRSAPCRAAPRSSSRTA